MPVLLLDQNVPHLATGWLSSRLPDWQVVHAFHLGLAVEPDAMVGDRAIELGAVVMTFDEDFLDTRSGLRERLPGVIRLRIWPTRWPVVVDAFERLLVAVEPDQFEGSAIIVDRNRVRVRPIR